MALGTLSSGSSSSRASGEVATICTSPAPPRGAKAIASSPRLVAAASTIGPGDGTPAGG